MIPKIRLSKSNLGELETMAIQRVMLEDGYLGMGHQVRSFEKALSDYLGGENQVVCVNSGTAALHLAVMAVTRPQEKDEILVQSLTYVASFQAISAAGAVPIACEVIPSTLTIDLQDAEKKITSRTKAIMPVHYAGRVGDLEAVYTFAAKHHLRVIEDAAHAFGTINQGKRVGSFGDIICFSFDGIKNITSGEGGAVVTKDKKIVQAVEDARLLGVHKDTENRYKGQRSWEFDVFQQGYRYHMSNLFAAIGIAQLSRLEAEFKPKRQALARKYNDKLSGLRNLVIFEDDYHDTVPHIYPIRILNEKRDSLRNFLLETGIECGIHYLPNHLLSYYGGQHGFLPHTEKIYSELLSLPLHSNLSDEEQNDVVMKIREWAS